MTLMLRFIVAGLCATLLALSGNASAQTWRKLPGAANDIGVGANGVAWIIGDTAANGGYSIHRFNGIGWELVPGAATRIDVDSKGNPWIVNSAGNIYRWTGTQWELKPGKATDIGIGANGAVWITGYTAEGGGYGVYRWGGASWVKVPGSAIRIDVDSAGNPWIVNNTGAIYRWSGSAFVKLPGAGVDISAGGDEVYLVGMGGAVYRWTGADWEKLEGQLAAISVDGEGRPWGMNASKQIYTSAPAPSSGPPIVTAYNAELVVSAAGTFAETSTGVWEKESVQYRELQRNDTSIQLQPIVEPASGTGTRYLIDFQKRAVFADLNGETPANPITAASAVSGLSVTYIELALYQPNTGVPLGVMVASESLSNGVSNGWSINAGGQRVAIPASLVVRDARSISLRQSSTVNPVVIDLIAGTCNAGEMVCRITKAMTTTGRNVGSLTMRSFNGPYTLTQTSSQGQWREESANMSAQPVWVESNRTIDSIDLTPPASSGVGKMRVYMDGRVLRMSNYAWSDNSAAESMVKASPIWKGQLGTIFAPISPAVSPGFQIQNKTDYPVLVTLEQVGCLYYQIVQPGQIFQRNTGAVWFTIKASMAPNLEEPTVESCIRKPAMYAATVLVTGLVAVGTGGTGTALVLPAMLATAAGQGAAIATQQAIAADGGTRLEASAGRVGVAALMQAGQFIGLAMLSGAGSPLMFGGALQAAMVGLPGSTIVYGGKELIARQAEQNDINAIKAGLIQEASVAGAYAGYPWPWKMSDRIMPRYDITGGPRIKTYPNGSTIVLKQLRPLTITRVN